MNPWIMRCVWATVAVVVAYLLWMWYLTLQEAFS
jgi:hypothetical protein